MNLLEQTGLRLLHRLDPERAHALSLLALRSGLVPLPGSGRMAEPGLQSVTPGSGLIMIAPVSVCHQVSTMGVEPPPM